MKKQDKKKAVGSFIRIEQATRDRLRRYCSENGLIMGLFASKLIQKFLDIEAKNYK